MNNYMANSLVLRQPKKRELHLLNNIRCGHYFIVFIYAFFALGAISNIFVFNLIGLFFLLIVTVFFDVKKTIVALASLTPNNMIVCLSNDSNVRLIGVFYLILLIRLLLKGKYYIKIRVILVYFGVLLISLLHFSQVGIHDFALCAQIITAIITWGIIIKRSSQKYKYNIYLYFAFGILLMFFGMLVNRVVNNTDRFVALLDDPNYTSVSFALLFSASLFFLNKGYKTLNNFVIFLFSIVGGLMTGSRSFLLSIGVVVLIYCLVGLRNKRARRVFLFIVVLLLLALVLLFFRVPFVVKVYDETIGRTLDLQSSYHQGAFMDITSGRVFLWNYYLNQLFSSSPFNIMFGFGLNYYLEENGGYGLVTHNSFVSGLMGFGIIGTILIITSYIFLLSSKKPLFRTAFVNKIIASTVLVSILVGYFFLDGLLDIRLSMYLSLFSFLYTFNFKKPNKQKVIQKSL